jgi:2-polyprenyl-6-methoxyphenol hydroxylase-like FAD-dependent oxidoreductase
MDQPSFEAQEDDDKAQERKPIMRVLISGGGMVGLTLAYWLQKSDIPSVVIEQAEDLRRDGYAIDFLGTGYNAAERMSLIDHLRSRHISMKRSSM